MNKLCFNDQTQAECLVAVKKNGLALEYVLYQTEEIIKAAVMQDGEALCYISPRNKYTQTEEIELLALKSTPEVAETLMKHMTMTVNTACAVLDTFEKVGKNRGDLADAIEQHQLKPILKMSKKDRNVIQKSNPEMAIIQAITDVYNFDVVDDEAVKESLTKIPSLFWFIGRTLFGHWKDRDFVAGKYAQFVLDMDVANKNTIGITSILKAVKYIWGGRGSAIKRCDEWKVVSLIMDAYDKNPLAGPVINSYGLEIVDGELTSIKS